MKLQISLLFLLIGTICAQERSISGATRRNRFSAGKSQAVNFNCPEDFGYYPHPSDCSQYYVCVFGGALLESCTGGLMYSTELQTCDWPRNVVCKSSSGPGVSTVKITDPRTRSTESNSIHSATESLSSSSIINRGLDNTITNRQPVKSSGLSKSIFDDSVKPRQGRLFGNQEDPQRIDGGFQAQETSSRTFNVVPASASPNAKLSFPWKSYIKKKSRKPRDAEIERQPDASSQNTQLSFFDNSNSKDPFDISFPTSAIFSARPRDRHNRQIGKSPFILPSFISSSFLNPFKPRHHRGRRPFQHSEESYQHSIRERHNPYSREFPREHYQSNSFVPSPPESYPEHFIPNFHSQERPDSPNQKNRYQDYHPPRSSPLHTQRDHVQPHTHAVQQNPRGPPKSVGSSNFAMNYRSPASNYPPSPVTDAFDDPFFTKPRSHYDDRETNTGPYFHEKRYNENLDNRRPSQNFYDDRANSNKDHHRNTIRPYNNDHKENLNKKPNFEQIPNVQTHNENQNPKREHNYQNFQQQNDHKENLNKNPNFEQISNVQNHNENQTPKREYNYQNFQQQSHVFVPPPIEGSVLLGSPEDHKELQNISEEEENITGKHIETDNSPKPQSEPNRIPITKLKTRVIPTKKTTSPEVTTTPKPFQEYISEKVFSQTPKRPQRGQSPKTRPKFKTKETLRKPPHIPGTARHPELSKLSVIDDDDKSPSLPASSNTNRFSSIRSTTFSPTTEKFGDILNSNDTDYYYYYDDILYDDYYEPTQKSTTAAPVVRSSNRGSSRNKPKTPTGSSPTSGGSPQVVGRTPQRPNPLYPTPQVDLTAAPCDQNICKLPDCYCGGRNIPGNIPVTSVPQLVLLTFDDAVNDLNKGLYKDLFEVGRTNPNGCPIAATFYVSHEWTDYTQVQNLYSDGHEIASHSVTHSFGEQFSTAKWAKEVAGQREIMSAYSGVRMEDIRGMRAPFLAVGGNNMFRMLYDQNFTYDSSMPVYENNPPSWPYTLDYKLFHDCMIPPCPTHSFPGVWQVPMVMWQDLTGGRCSMGDACTTPPDAEGVYKMLIKNFERHYTTNRSPFGLFYHAAWFTTPHHKEGFIAFLDTISAMDDVWLVTNWQALQWVRDPTPLSKAKSFPPFQCDYPERPPRCTTPKVCNVWHKGSVRYLKTCYTCPESYPWVGNTGVQSPLNDV